ncbi:MAG: SAV_6107 family HEPN domain-containing protein [Nakamurella sp.]
MTTFMATDPGVRGAVTARSAHGSLFGMVQGGAVQGGAVQGGAVRGGVVHGAVPQPRRGRVPVSRTSRDLVSDASRVLGRAIGEGDPQEKFALAHLAALRGAAGVLAARARPRRMAQGSAWELLARMAPELAEWSAFFAAGARRRQAIVAGVHVDVTAREADDLVRAVSEFLDLVEATLTAPSASSGR